MSRDEDRRLQRIHETNDAEGSRDVARWGSLSQIGHLFESIVASVAQARGYRDVV